MSLAIRGSKSLARQSPSFDRAPVAQCGLGAGLWLLVACIQGYDIDWDVPNYHFYNGYALLHGKVFSNLAVSMQQSFYPPILDAAFYSLVCLLPPSTVSASIAVFQSLVFPITFQLVRVVLSTTYSPGVRLNSVAMCLAAFGAAAPVNVWKAGGAFGDTTTAVFVLAALLILVETIVFSRTRAPARRMIAAGAFAGAAAGLKLTNLSFVLGLVATLIVPLVLATSRAERRAWGVTASIFMFSVCIWFLMTYGWWGLLLSKHFGNPVFPNFNQLFLSPYAAPASYADPVFAIPTLREKLLFPFSHAPIIGHLGSSLLLDARMAFALPLCILGVVAVLIRRTRTTSAATGVPSAHVAMLAFILVSYIAWLLVFPIHLYLAPVDMIAPLGCVIAVEILWKPQRSLILIAVLGLALPASARVSRHYWWRPDLHQHGNAGGYFGVNFVRPPDLDGSIVAMLSDLPTAFVIPFFPEDVTFVRLQGSLQYFYPGFDQLGPSSSRSARRAVFRTALGNAICRRLDENKGALFLLRPGPDTAHDKAAMTYFGLTQAPGECIAIATKTYVQLRLCRASRLSTPECRE